MNERRLVVLEDLPWIERPASRATRPTETAPLQPGLRATGVTCWFGERKVLEDVHLDMPHHRITALIGPSGCGKSTFLRTLNRMHETIPGASITGDVSLGGMSLYADDVPAMEVRRRVGMVFQQPNPFPAMSIADNVLAGHRLTGRRGGDREEIVESCLRRAGLWTEAKDRLHAPGTSLSGGQQQRLCIARALAMDPEVLLMDEPCSALDPISTGVIEETMAAIRQEVTIVIVTHNMQQARRVSDRCALFLVEGDEEVGRVVEDGPTAEVFERPRDARTGDYIAGRFG